MADMAPPTPANEARRVRMLQAAAELIGERGFAETRVADVAERAEASSALVIYYFGTRDRLLVDALRYSEEQFYDRAEKTLAEVPALRDRLALLVTWTCGATPGSAGAQSWGLWFDLWTQAFRKPEVKADRVGLEQRWRTMIADMISTGRAAGEVGRDDVDERRFALAYSALLDGLSIQVALDDPVVDYETATAIAMSFAEKELGLEDRAASCASGQVS